MEDLSACGKNGVADFCGGADLTWWFDFVFVRLGDVRQDTRDLVRILDLRSFAKDTYDFATDQNSRFLQSLHLALKLCPNINALLLDGHTEIDPNSLIELTKTHSYPLLLSISNCTTRLPNTFYSLPSLQRLLYLDISGNPGSVVPLTQRGLLPDLRILKARGREVDDATFKSLASSHKLKLWSLDLAHNRLTDDIISTLVDLCFPRLSLRSEAHFRVEGELTTPKFGSSEYGPFVTIDESASSASFNHPERYFLDPPTYNAEPYSDNVHHQIFRSDMRGPMRDDSADGATETLSHNSANYDIEEAFRTSRGITHLNLSHNRISGAGLERLLRISNGQLEHLACDYMPLLPSTIPLHQYWPQSTNLFGIIGAAHVFRPVFSSNLRSLRIHHSFVTNIPSLEAEGFSTLASLFLAENPIRQRVDEAYPHAFVPDMNPRIASLTLTCVPRRSSGPVIERLLKFLQLLSKQERAIQDRRKSTIASSSWRWPGMLKGLRHLRLEFEPDPMEEGFSTAEDLDAESLMNSGDRGFSFFDYENPQRPLSESKPRFATIPSRSASLSSNTHLSSDSITPTPTTTSRDTDDEYVNYDGTWNGQNFTIPVWVGSKSASTRSAIVEEYRKLVLQQRLHDGVGPATSCQIAAGVPDKTFIFHTAWCVAIMPRTLLSPALADLAGMRDVLVALKTYRSAGRVKYLELQRQSQSQAKSSAQSIVPVALGDPHLFWTGRLEVSTQAAIPHARSSQYWR